MVRMTGLALALLFNWVAGYAQPQKTDPTKLDLDRIFVSEELKAKRGPAVKWVSGSSYTALQPSKKFKGASDLVLTDVSGKTEVLVTAEQLIPAKAKEPLQIQGYELASGNDLVLIYTNSVKVWRQNTRGDYWIYRRSTGKLARLGGDAKPSTLMFAKLSPDGKLAGYVRDNNLYVEPVDGGPIRKLTSDGTPQIINGTFDWVYEEEFDCRDGWNWSPDSKQIAYWQLDTRGVKTFTLVDNTAGQYQSSKTFAYPKTGERNSACRVGVIGAAGGKTTWFNVPGDTKTDCYIPRMAWRANSQELALLRVNRLQNQADLMLGDTRTGEVRTCFTDRDGAWIDLQDESMQWAEKGKSLTWLSEVDGWRHLYLASCDGSKVRRLTKGPFDVTQTVYCNDQCDQLYYMASPENATQRYLYRSTTNGNHERVTPADQPGWHEYKCSPDGSAAIHTYSSFGSPPLVEVVSLPEHRLIRTLEDNKKLREAVRLLEKTPVEFLRTDIGQGVQLDGWLMKPARFDPAKKYPLLFFVYGEPAGQTVTDRWGDGRYLWHLMLTQQGYAVACVDNRGTPCPRGREWRKSVYRQIGTLASKDQSTAARELLKKPYLDASRVGVWGWSGGGSMTLNLLFRHPEIYKTGISVAPVPDMRLYDTIYQERYMGLPKDNAEDYKRGSPITHAAGLQGKLLLIHGTGDDNCHYQGTEKLIDRLIELNKPFTMMAYPNRSHSVNEGKNTTRHLYGLMTRYLHENLPAK